MTAQTCQNCASWVLKGSDMKDMGFGKCKAQPDPIARAAKSLAAGNLCRIGRFTPAEAAVVARREKELGLIL